jgi:hypothetical protein
MLMHHRGVEEKLYTFLTSALAGDEYDPATLLSGKEPPVPTGQETGCAPLLIWSWQTEKALPLLEIKSLLHITKPIT